MRSTTRRGFATASAAALSLQDDEAAAQAARERAQQEGVTRAREQQALKADKARQDWIQGEQAKSESNLDYRARQLAPFRGRENENKFGTLQRSTQELVDLSKKISDEVDASGAQSISISFYSDLDQLEKLVKTIRKSAK